MGRMAGSPDGQTQSKWTSLDAEGRMQEVLGEAVVNQSLVNAAQGRGYAVETHPTRPPYPDMPQIMPAVLDKVLKRRGR